MSRMPHAPAGTQPPPRPDRYWRSRSACLTEDPELFFPIGSTGPAVLQIEQAKAVCRGCVVQVTCLQWALDTGQRYGVWGGLSEDELYVEKRRQDRQSRRQRQALEASQTSQADEVGELGQAGAEGEVAA